MELKQLSESISLISHKRRIDKSISKGDVSRNMPAIWREKLRDGYPYQDQQFFRVANKADMYKVSFDPSLGLEDIWVNSDCLNLFNSQRDNIYVSSSQIDVVMLRSKKAQFYHAERTIDKKRGNISPNSKKRSKSTPQPSNKSPTKNSRSSLIIPSKITLF
jgi:hypothetical protein